MVRLFVSLCPEVWGGADPVGAFRHAEHLINVYGADGWKGSNREKCKPTGEIKNARRQVCFSAVWSGNNLAPALRGVCPLMLAMPLH